MAQLVEEMEASKKEHETQITKLHKLHAEEIEAVKQELGKLVQEAHTEVQSLQRSLASEKAEVASLREASKGVKLSDTQGELTELESQLRAAIEVAEAANKKVVEQQTTIKELQEITMLGERQENLGLTEARDEAESSTEASRNDSWFRAPPKRRFSLPEGREARIDASQMQKAGYVSFKRIFQAEMREEFRGMSEEENLKVAKMEAEHASEVENLTAKLSEQEALICQLQSTINNNPALEDGKAKVAALERELAKAKEKLAVGTAAGGVAPEDRSAVRRRSLPEGPQAQNLNRSGLKKPSKR